MTILLGRFSVHKSTSSSAVKVCIGYWSKPSGLAPYQPAPWGQRNWPRTLAVPRPLNSLRFAPFVRPSRAARRLPRSIKLTRAWQARSPAARPRSDLQAMLTPRAPARSVRAAPRQLAGRAPGPLRPRAQMAGRPSPRSLGQVRRWPFSHTRLRARLFGLRLGVSVKNGPFCAFCRCGEVELDDHCGLCNPNCVLYQRI